MFYDLEQSLEATSRLQYLMLCTKPLKLNNSLHGSLSRGFTNFRAVLAMH